MGREQGRQDEKHQQKLGAKICMKYPENSEEMDLAIWLALKFRILKQEIQL